MCNMERIGLTVSEEMSFENVDGRTQDACIYYKLTYEPGELKMDNFQYFSIKSYVVDVY